MFDNNVSIINKKFNKVLAQYQEIVRQIDKNIKVKRGDDWECDVEEETIYIPLLQGEKGAIEFKFSLVKEMIDKSPLEHLDLFMYSLLHEIGHLKSKQGDLISKVGRVVSRKACQMGLDKIARDIYYNLPEEKNATIWAIDYAWLHLLELKQEQKTLRNAYNTFYAELGVTE